MHGHRVREDNLIEFRVLVRHHPTVKRDPHLLVFRVNARDRIRILKGDFRERLYEPIIEEGSVDLILTDPPYGREYLTLWGDLAEFAATALKPGKLLVTYSGNHHLAQVINLLSKRLQYVWTAAVMNGTELDTVFPRKIITYWKPILLFSKGEYRPVEKTDWFKDRIEGDGRCKRHYEWERGLGEAT